MSVPRTVRAFPLRWHLLLLVVGTLVPLVIFAGVVLVRVASEERAATERRLLLAATAMADELDRDVAGSLRILEAFARLEHLERGDMAGFHADASEAVAVQPAWRAIILYDADGQPIVNTRFAWGKPLPAVNDAPSLRAVIETHRPAIGALRAAEDGGWAFPVRVPIMHEDKVRFVLTAVIDPSVLQRLVTRVSTPEEWMRAVIDSNGVVAARRTEPERFVGQVSSVNFLDHVGRANEGVYRDVARDGLPVHVAFCRAGESGWTAVVAAPQDAVDAPVYRSILSSTFFGAAIVTLTGIGAWLFARRLERSIASAATAATALAHGERPFTEPSRITEVAQLVDSLWRSSDLLISRQRERDENLARAESSAAALAELNANLEQTVRRRTAESEQRSVQLRALAAELSTAEDRERRRIASRLHDHLQQVLAAARLRLTAAAARPLSPEAAADVAEAARLLDESLAATRDLTVELSPPVLRDEGLAPALAWLGRQMYERHGLSVEVHADPAAQPADEVLAAFIFQAARELLFNIVKHAGVNTAHLSLRHEEPGHACLTIADAGRGFDPELAGVGPAGGAGFGLFSIRERLAHLGGRMTINSRPGRSTTIVMLIPRRMASARAASPP